MGHKGQSYPQLQAWLSTWGLASIPHQHCTDLHISFLREIGWRNEMWWRSVTLSRKDRWTGSISPRDHKRSTISHLCPTIKWPLELGRSELYGWKEEINVPRELVLKEARPKVIGFKLMCSVTIGLSPIISNHPVMARHLNSFLLCVSRLHSHITHPISTFFRYLTLC